MSYNLEQNRERQRRWYELHKKEKNILTRERYDRFVEQDLCPTCSGRNEPKLDHILCQQCLDKRKRRRNKNERH